MQNDTEIASASPNLFGTDFSKQAKEYLDQVKTLEATLPPYNKVVGIITAKTPRSHFFERASPQGGEWPEEGVVAPTICQEDGAMEGGYPGEPSDSDTHTTLCFVDSKNKIEKYTSNSVHDCSYGHSATEYPSSPSEVAGSLFAELVNNHRGLVGPKHSESLQNSLQVSASLGQKATPSPSQSKTAGLARGLGIDHQGGGTGVDKHAGEGFVSTLFLVQRKNGGQRPVINLKNLTPL